jgi:hypothetical protein
VMWCCAVLCGAVWRCVALCGAVWCGVVWCGVWYDVVFVKHFIPLDLCGY